MYAAAGGLSLARRQARRQQRQQAAESRPTLKPPSTPLPPIRHQFHSQQHHQDEELLQMSKDVQAQLLEPPNSSELNGRISSFGSSELSPEVGFVTKSYSGASIYRDNMLLYVI
ncbi:hypothetical protein L9F63_006236 [Diploptera punctata]|uniref:Uncharacterized protein n=1 Tax=Diploptera punctata TaxID=6984 RepID=A0AAD7ZAZ2_DIPPU|nr:hypothetical protein L9F63_006236 [Diploptera punctata]